MKNSTTNGPNRLSVLLVVTLGIIMATTSCGQSSDNGITSQTVDQGAASVVADDEVQEPTTQETTTTSEPTTTTSESTTTTEESSALVYDGVEWDEYVSPTGGYTVILPVEGRVDQPQTIPSEVGDLIVNLVLVEIDLDWAYGSSHTDYPQSVVVDLDGAVTGTVNGSIPGGEVTKNEEITVSGYECREFAGEGKIQSNDAELIGIVCEAANKRLVQLIGVGTLGLAELPETRAFLDSLEIE